MQTTIETAIVHQGWIPLPPGVLKGFGIRGHVQADVVGTGKLRVSEGAEASVSDRGVLALKAPQFAAAKFKAGDVVAFGQSAPSTFDVYRINKTKHETFLRPPLDQFGYPIPPSWLVQAFTGKPDVISYLNSGDTTVRFFDSELREVGANLKDMDRIVDFGCGVGRVIRALPRHTKADLFGIDLHPDAIAWCGRNLNFAHFMLGTEYPPTSLEDDSADFLYAVSVLTHLDEVHQDKWLAEWRRIVKPGGIVIATYRDEEFIRSNPTLGPADLLTDLENSSGILFRSHKHWDGIFPEFYAGTYHKNAYLDEHWGTYFDILKKTPPNAFPSGQNAAIMRKRRRVS